MNSVRLGHERVCFSNVSRLVKMILRSQEALSRSPPVNSVRLGHERVCFSNVPRLVEMILRSHGALSRSPPVKSLNGEMKGLCWCKWNLSSISWFSRSFHSVPNIIPSNQTWYKVNIEPYRHITNLRIYMFEPSPVLQVTNRRRFRWWNG
jgi:hypothetical protein